MVVPAAGALLMRWHAAGLTDVGRERRRNEDALAVEPSRRLFAVADGMGGHAEGHVASRLAVETLLATFPRAPSSRIAASTLSRRLITAFDAANRAILDHAAKHPRCAGMGTTLTTLVPLANMPACVIAHIGDSRAYRLRAGALVQLTHDHTWVQQQVDAGILTSAQARSHPLSSVLSRVLGTPQIGPPDTFMTHAEPDDVFLLCSDGLTNMIDDVELRALLARPLPPEQLARDLVDAANAFGGRDNITCILLRTEAA